MTKTSLVRPKILRSVHYCPEGRIKFYYKDYVDMLSATDNIAPTSSVIPLTNNEQQTLEFEFGYSKYVNFQTITIQEMPERAPFGQLPRSIDVALSYDLVDQLKPGDRVRIYGIYKPIAPSASTISGNFRSIIDANNVQLMGSSINTYTFSTTDISLLRKFSRNPKLFDILANSIAPSIRGLETIKKALLLQMLGGKEQSLANGIHLRGDINILLVGDPSCGKSQLLRFVLNNVPLAINTTGRGSSGVGLTAAVVKDQETGERRLEAGAMVLADGGVVCIDEFDKMSEIDRVAIHEVMEQQTVTIAKAGIHCSLNARCSVLAAANPVYGQYDPSKRPQDNVGLPDSLLSRFDLLFIVRDEMDNEKDRSIAHHVLWMHRYVKPGHENIPEMDDDNEEEEHVTNLKEQYVKNFQRNNRGDLPVLTTDFFRAYVRFAKTRDPILTDDAIKLLVDNYAELRQKSDNKTLPVTARMLETLIRLSTAHAKMRLSQKVEKVDCEDALRLVEFALFNDAEVIKKPKKKPVEERELVFSDEEEGEAKKVRTEESDKQSQQSQQSSKEGEEGAMEEEVEVSDEKYSAFRSALSKLYTSRRTDSMTLQEIMEIAPSLELDEREVKACLDKMIENNQVMESENSYYRI